MYYERGTFELLSHFANEKVLFKELSSGIIFEATPFELARADFEFNKQFQIVGQATIADFLSYFGIETNGTEITKGWCFDCFDGWEAPIIDFTCKHTIEDNKVIFTLEASIGPCAGFMDCMGCFSESGQYVCEGCGSL